MTTHTATRPIPSTGIAIDIKPGRDGRWYVTADAGYGLMHDDFATQAEAISFAQDYYGGTVQTIGGPKASKPACRRPKAYRTAHSLSLAKYKTTIKDCGCPDFTERGGSCYDAIQRDRCCYHMLTLRCVCRGELRLIDDGAADFFGYSLSVAV